MNKIKFFIKLVKTIKNWPVFILDSLNLISCRYIYIRLRNGLFYYIKTKSQDKSVIKEIFIYNCYNPNNKFKIRNYDVIFDIGAQKGVFSIFASKCANKGKVYSFEPTRENFKFLKKNVKLNKIENIILINKAVSDKSGEKEIFISADSGGHSFFWKTPNRVIVQTICLNDFIKQNNISHVDFLKMDCEGAEYEILFSCSNETFKKIKKISMECHELDNIRNSLKLKEFLEKKGFNVSRTSTGMLYAIK